MVRRLRQKEWVHIAKALANDNRFTILRILWNGSEKNVTELSERLNISVKATSRNLVLLEKQGLVEGTGKKNRVFYRIVSSMPQSVWDVLEIIIRNVRS